jgi:Flp pilus assembly protein TadD
MGKHEPDQAISEYQQALQLDPNFPEAEIGLGTAYTAKGMRAEAEQAYRKAAALQRNQNR